MRSPAAPPASNSPACYQGIYPGHTDQARNVRSEVADWLALAGCLAAIIDDAKVIASELAANAVLHSASRGASFTVRCEIDSSCVRIEVEDLGGPWRPRRPDDRPHGLDLVEALVGPDSWGSEPGGDGGRLVWVRLPWEQR
jgi:anti-sigma regulatory factor (Ser/Thr protein kinase)